MTAQQKMTLQGIWFRASRCSRRHFPDNGPLVEIIMA